jgi:uncharacterized membrane protein YciS (DUF1049 family)
MSYNFVVSELDLCFDALQLRGLLIIFIFQSSIIMGSPNYIYVSMQYNYVPTQYNYAVSTC